MLGSRCDVQDWNNHSDRAVGIGLHSPSAKARDVWLRFVRTKRKNFNPKLGTKFVIYSVHFEEHCLLVPFTQASVCKSSAGPCQACGRRTSQEKCASHKEIAA